MRQLSFDPYLPLALWATLALLAVGALVWYAVSSRGRLATRRRWIVLTLMSLAVVPPLVVLLNPTWVEELPPPAGKPLLTVLVDTSASMATKDAADGESRFTQARRAAVLLAEKLSSRYDVRLRTFADESQPIELSELSKVNPQGGSTNLAAALRQSLDDDRPQGQAMVLLTDGIPTAGTRRALREVATRAKALNAPIFIQPLGDEATRVPDLDVTTARSEELAFVGQKVPVRVTLRQTGALAASVSLSLLRDGEEIEQRSVDLVADGETSATFQIEAQDVGLYRYEVRAMPLAGEATDVNNSVTLLLRAVDEPVGVLLLEGKPYWDSKFLVRTLAADRSVALTSIVQMAQGRFMERTVTRQSKGENNDEDSDEDNAQPEGEDASGDEIRSEEWRIRRNVADLLAEEDVLSKYQIVVLGREADVFLTDKAIVALRKWLADGEGSLVCFRGAPTSQMNQRLAALMPVRWRDARENRFRMEWTETGANLGWLPAGPDDETGVLPRMPSLATVFTAETRGPLARVLAQRAGDDSGGPAVPTLAYQQVGLGRVVVVEGAGMWRWAFLPPQHKQQDEVYGVLWRGLVRWLVSNGGLLPSQTMSLRSDRVTFSTTEQAAATLLVRQEEPSDEPPKIELTGKTLSQPKVILATPSGDYPGQFRIAFGQLPQGRYRASVVGEEDNSAAVTLFDVRKNLREQLDVRPRRGLIESDIAVASGGAMLADATPEAIAEQFDQHLSKSRPPQIRRTAAWDRWWVLVMVLGMWAATWGVRRSSGLV